MPATDAADAFIREALGSEMMSALQLLDVCMSEIERAGVTSTLPRDVFMMLRPPDCFLGLHEDLYRSHVRELLGRHAAGDRFDTGTTAEVLIGLMHTSFQAPLNQGGYALYHRMFRKVFGDVLTKRIFGDGPEPREMWDGQTDELEDQARRKVRTGRPKRPATA